MNSVDNLIETEYVVCECGECFENEQSLILHFAKCHPEWDVGKQNTLEEIEPKYVKPSFGVKLKKTRNVKTKCPPPRNIVCEYCGRKYVSNAALINHQRAHTGEKPFICPVCDKCFGMNILLQTHIRIHTGEKPYICSVCGKSFNNKTALNRHGKVHTGEKPYICPECKKGFTQSNSMKLHVMTVHLKMPAPYKDKRNHKIKYNFGDRSYQDFCND